MLRKFPEGNVTRDTAAAATERSEASTGRPSAEQQAAGAQGSCLSNTNPHTRLIELAGFPELLATGGMDWFEWTAVLKWKPRYFESLCAAIAEGKTKCQESNIPETWIDLPRVAATVRVSRLGINRGGDHGQYFDFKFCYKGIWIGLAKRREGTRKLPNLFVCQKGRDCLLHGAREAYALVCEFIRSAGASVFFSVLSRVDLCLDITGLDVAGLQMLVERRQFVTRARTVRPYRELIGDVRSGFAVGEVPLRLVVYDKLEEQAGTHDELYLQALIDRRWGGQQPEKAGRIEFQVRRAKLVEVGIDSPEDLFQLSGSLLEKLTTEWFRLTAEEVDRENKHQDRVDTLPLWKSISAAMAEVFGAPAGPLVPLAREKITASRLLRQSIGCAISALLQIGVPVATFDDFIFATVQQYYKQIATAEDREELVQEYILRGKEHLL